MADYSWTETDDEIYINDRKAAEKNYAAWQRLLEREHDGWDFSPIRSVWSCEWCGALVESSMRRQHRKGCVLPNCNPFEPTDSDIDMYELDKPFGERSEKNRQIFGRRGYK